MANIKMLRLKSGGTFVGGGMEVDLLAEVRHNSNNDTMTLMTLSMLKRVIFVLVMKNLNHQMLKNSYPMAILQLFDYALVNISE